MKKTEAKANVMRKGRNVGNREVREELEKLISETRNLGTRRLSDLSSDQIVRMINEEDQAIAISVEKVIPNIVRAVKVIVYALQNGGRLFYIGAGTSGRLGVIDAAELLPTFGVGKETVQAIIAGGQRAVFRSVEGAEDDARAGAEALRQRRISKKDIVLGISASGRTPFVIGALKYARKKRASTLGLTVNPSSPIWSVAEIIICPVTGPEVLAGSTRMKAGTAQKMVLNMLSTTVMIKLGKVYGNLMVDLKPFSKKLVERSKKIVISETGLSYKQVERLLKKTNMNAKLAILVAKRSLTIHEAQDLLASSGGSLANAIRKRISL